MDKYIVIEMKEQLVYVVTHATDVARMLNKHPQTVRNWFKGGNKVKIIGRCLIAYGYEEVKSRRPNIQEKATASA